jgi:hypothetical protein
MTAGSDPATMPLLDDWIGEVGEDQVVGDVHAAVEAIAEGTTPGFTDKEALLAYIGRRTSS